MNKLIALIPAYEPTSILYDLTFELSKSEFDVVIVNDGSSNSFDNIFNICTKYAHVISYDKNMGKGYALKEGLKYIYNNYKEPFTVVTLDSDGQHSISDSLKVINSAEEKSGQLILGSRKFDGDVPKRSMLGNSITRFVYRLFTGLKVYDTQTGLRAFSSNLIPFMLKIDGNRYEYEMNVLLECSRSNIPIFEEEIKTIYFDDNSGSHFNTVKDSFRVYKEIFKFAASSFISFIVDYLMYTILVIFTGGLGATISIPLSNILARITSASVNFGINKKYVFKNKDNIFKTAIQYFVLAAIILIGNTFLLSFLVSSVGINKFVAKLITEITFFTLSWLVQKFIIFKKKAEPQKIPDKNGGLVL